MLAAGSLAGCAVSTAEDIARAVALGVRSAMRRGVMLLEPQKGPWVNQNLWGDQRTQPFPASAGIVVNVLGKNTIMYGPPTVHSVQLARGDDVLPSNADVRARITYGCGGVENTFDCDWLHGAQFSLVCNSVSVAAVSYAPNINSAYLAAGGAVFLGASVAKGSVNQGACGLTYTEPQITVAAARSYDVKRDFTREVCVHLAGNNNPATPTNVFVELINSGGFLVRYDAQVCAGGRRIPVPGGANTLLLSSAAPFTPIVQWFLGL